MIAQLPTVAPSANYPEFLEALRNSGFDGFRAAGKALAPNDLPVFKRPGLPKPELCRYAALPPAAAKGRSHDDRVARVDQLIDLGLSLVELASQPADELLVSLWPVKAACAVGDQPGRGVPAVLGKVRNSLIDIPAAVGLESPAHHLHVRL